MKTIKTLFAFVSLFVLVSSLQSAPLKSKGASTQFTVTQTVAWRCSTNQTQISFIQLLNDTAEVTIDWGDGTIDNFNDGLREAEHFHTYDAVGSHEIKVMLDASKVEMISIENQGITFLDVSSLSGLQVLNAYSNKIENAQDLRTCTSLMTLDLSSNRKLPSIDLSGLSSLINLNLNGCRLLGSLDLSGNTDLTACDLGGNRFTSVNLSGLGSLKAVDLSENKLTDVSTPIGQVLQALQSNGNSQKGIISVQGNSSTPNSTAQTQLATLSNSYNWRVYQ